MEKGLLSRPHGKREAKLFGAWFLGLRFGGMMALGLESLLFCFFTEELVLHTHMLKKKGTIASARVEEPSCKLGF